MNNNNNNNNSINSKTFPSVRLQGPDQTQVAVLAVSVVLAVLVVLATLALAVVASTRREHRLPWSFLLP
jgi:hypothetical protein